MPKTLRMTVPKTRKKNIVTAQVAARLGPAG
jgi:hypothetical protein